MKQALLPGLGPQEAAAVVGTQKRVLDLFQEMLPKSWQFLEL